MKPYQIPRVVDAMLAAQKECPAGLDAHQFAAARVAGVGYDQVTKEQRQAVKMLTFGARL